MRTCCVHRALGDLLNVLEKLGLGSAGVPQQEHVDIAPEAVGAGGVLLLATKQRKRDAGLDVEVAVDRGRYALEDALACGRTCATCWPCAVPSWLPGHATMDVYTGGCSSHMSHKEGP